MKWSEMSITQKILFVGGCTCIAVWFVLMIIDEMGVLEIHSAVRHALQGGWSIGFGCAQKPRWLRVAWYVIAGLRFLACLLALM